VAALSVMTRRGIVPVEAMARSKNERAAGISRLGEIWNPRSGPERHWRDRWNANGHGSERTSGPPASPDLRVGGGAGLLLRTGEESLNRVAARASHRPVLLDSDYRAKPRPAAQWGSLRPPVRCRASSSVVRQTTRRRLNWGGHRQAHSALHIVRGHVRVAMAIDIVGPTYRRVRSVAVAAHRAWRVICVGCAARCDGLRTGTRAVGGAASDHCAVGGPRRCCVGHQTIPLHASLGY
jgi:hypothetical protein